MLMRKGGSVVLTFMFLMGCTNSAERNFRIGCEKIEDHFNQERKEKKWAAIDGDYQCSKRIKKRMSAKFFQDLKSMNAKQQQAAGCGFGVASYISGYFSEYAPERLTLYMAEQNGDRSRMLEVANEYCGEVGLLVKADMQVESEEEFASRMAKRKKQEEEKKQAVAFAKDFSDKLAVGETICTVGKSSSKYPYHYRIAKLVEKRADGKLEFVSGRYSDKSKTIEVRRDSYDNKPETTTFTPEELAAEFEKTDLVIGKEACVQAMDARLNETAHELKAAGIHTGQIVCKLSDQADAPATIYKVQSVTVESMNGEDTNPNAIPQERAVLKPIVWSSKQRKIASVNDDYSNPVYFYASDLKVDDHKNGFIADEKKCLDLAKAQAEKVARGESF